jgi:hypothetical protein
MMTMPPPEPMLPEEPIEPARQAPSLGYGCQPRSRPNSVAPERTTLRDTPADGGPP